MDSINNVMTKFNPMKLGFSVRGLARTSAYKGQLTREFMKRVN